MWYYFTAYCTSPQGYVRQLITLQYNGFGWFNSLRPQRCTIIVGATCYCYRPQRSWGKVMFSQACVIPFMGGVCLSACWDTTPGADTPMGADLPRSRACWEIRSTHGRYASYWNAILLKKSQCLNTLSW